MPRSPSPSRPRDLRLDVWRGLCLADMIVVHLFAWGLSISHGVDRFFTEYFRFAAGGFIFMAGVSVGFIFLPRARVDLRATSRKLVRRAGYILLVHFLLEIAFLIRDPLPGAARWHDFWRAVWLVFTFRAGYDLLPFYAMMMLVAPLILAALSRGWWKMVAAISIGIFALGSINPYRVALPIQQTFFPALWQPFFVGGALFGAALPAFDRLTRQRKLSFAGALLVLFFILEWLAYGQDFSLPFAAPQLFSKLPLTTLEAIRYFALTLLVIFTVDFAWPRLANARFIRLLAHTGALTLSVYVAHVWFVSAIASRMNGFPPAIKLLAIPLSLAVATLVVPFARAWRALLSDARRNGAAALSLTRLAAALLAIAVLPKINDVVWPIRSPAPPMPDSNDATVTQFDFHSPGARQNFPPTTNHLKSFSMTRRSSAARNFTLA